MLLSLRARQQKSTMAPRAIEPAPPTTVPTITLVFECLLTSEVLALGVTSTPRVRVTPLPMLLVALY